MIGFAVKLFSNFVLGCLLFSIIYNVFIVVSKYRIVRFAWNNSKMFFVPMIPFIGNLITLMFLGLKVEILGPFTWMEKNFGFPFNFWLGSEYIYCTTDPTEALAILSHPKCLDKPDVFKAFDHLFPNCLLTAPTSDWKPRRKYLRPAYKAPTLKYFYYTYNQISHKLVKDLKSAFSQGDAETMFRLHAFRCFFFTSAGYYGKEVDGKLEKLAIELDRFQKELSLVMFSPLKMLLTKLKSPFAGDIMKDIQGLKASFKDIYMDILQERNNSADYKEDSNSTLLLDLLFSENYEKISKNNEKLEDIFLFTVAATESSGNLLAFIFTLLGMHPDVQDRLYEEVTTEVGDGDIGFEELSKLKYTEAVINETLRIFPTVPMVVRKVTEDINIGNKMIPKGVEVAVSAFHMHRNKNYWKDPLKFDPSRFLPENASNIVTGSFLPFSVGVRDCPGKISSMIIAKNVIASVVRNFKAVSNHKSIEELGVGSVITLHTHKPLDCNFIPR